MHFHRAPPRKASPDGDRISRERGKRLIRRGFRCLRAATI
jgi:hypothetical protein